jgi:hypothetical protein
MADRTYYLTFYRVDPDGSKIVKETTITSPVLPSHWEIMQHVPDERWSFYSMEARVRREDADSES